MSMLWPTLGLRMAEEQNRSVAAPALQRTVGFNMQYWTSDVAENKGKNLSSSATLCLVSSVMLY